MSVSCRKAAASFRGQLELEFLALDEDCCRKLWNRQGKVPRYHSEGHVLSAADD